MIRFVLFASLIALACSQSVNVRVEECANEPGTFGYVHVININSDQQDELERIASGEAPRKPYVFTFCKETKYLIEESTLQVLLDDVTFRCGSDGVYSNLCQLEGGLLQVHIPERVITNVAFQGVTFLAGEGVGIGAYANSSSTLTMTSTRFALFTGSSSLISMKNSRGEPMTVSLTNTLVQEGTGGTLFENEAGSLTVNDMYVEKSTAEELFLTAMGGSTSLQGVTVRTSNITQLTATLSSGSANVQNLEVSRMTGMGSVVYVDGTGSSADVNSITIRDNYLLDSYETSTFARNFNGIVAKNSAVATSENVTVIDNNGIDCVVRASSGSEVRAIDYSIERSNGTSPPDFLSSVFLAEDGSLLNILRAEMRLNYGYSGVYMAVCGSFLQVVQSCLHTGKVSNAAFVSSESDFRSVNNYISLDMETLICLDDPLGNLLLKEDPGFTCFLTGNCKGQCTAGFREENTTCTILSATKLNLQDVALPAVTDGTCLSIQPTNPPGFVTLPDEAEDATAGTDNGAAGEGGDTPETNVFDVDRPDNSSATSDSTSGGSSTGGAGTTGTSGSSGARNDATIHWTCVVSMIAISFSLLALGP